MQLHGKASIWLQISKQLNASEIEHRRHCIRASLKFELCWALSENFASNRKNHESNNKPHQMVHLVLPYYAD